MPRYSINGKFIGAKCVCQFVTLPNLKLKGFSLRYVWEML